ncbi:hypothetical protein [Haladaptatus litoreus]|uniref:hypothetical protein n=1 Tax=Haladaptatus litoreus TaxID=553468 RepID=UPI001115794C|nr:hypothetical protein [Haladaptatus litoreus]
MTTEEVTAPHTPSLVTRSFQSLIPRSPVSTLGRTAGQSRLGRARWRARPLAAWCLKIAERF